MIGEKIKQLRMDSGLTQKDLAGKLFVTAQAVSRWENNEVEPSLSTISELAKIFNVSVSELLGEEQAKPEVVIEKEVVYKEQAPVLAVCEQCNRPIYKAEEIVRQNDYDRTRVLCSACAKKNKKEKENKQISYGKKQRILSFVWGGIIASIVLAVLMVLTIPSGNATAIIGAAVIGVLTYTFVSCIFLKNNFILDMVYTVASWGFIRFPGLIFSLDLDGIIWLLTVKLAFWIIGFLLGALFLILAVALGMILSVFVYPFALGINIRHPEKTDEF